MTAATLARYSEITFTAKQCLGIGPWIRWACCTDWFSGKSQSEEDQNVFTIDGPIGEKICPEAPGKRHCPAQHARDAPRRSAFLCAIQPGPEQDQFTSGKAEGPGAGP